MKKNADQMGLFGEESSEMSTELIQFKPWDTLERMKKEKRASLGSSLPALRWMPAGKKSKIISAV